MIQTNRWIDEKENCSGIQILSFRWMVLSTWFFDTQADSWHVIVDWCSWFRISLLMMFVYTMKAAWGFRCVCLIIMIDRTDILWDKLVRVCHLLPDSGSHVMFIVLLVQKLIKCWYLYHKYNDKCVTSYMYMNESLYLVCQDIE